MPPKRKQKRKFLAKLVNTAVGSVVIATDDDDGPPDNQTLINTHFALKLPPCTAKCTALDVSVSGEIEALEIDA